MKVLFCKLYFYVLHFENYKIIYNQGICRSDIRLTVSHKIKEGGNLAKDFVQDEDMHLCQICMLVGILEAAGHKVTIHQ